MICHSSRELLLYCYEWSNSCNATSHKCTLINFYQTTKVIRQEPRSKFCNTVSFVCNIRSVRLDLINTSIHISLYALCVVPMLLYTIIHWLSFRHMSSTSITKQAILRSIFFSRRISIWVLLELVCRSTQHFTKIDQEKCKIEQIWIWNPRTTGFIM